jgi:hypothetical protein
MSRPRLLTLYRRGRHAVGRYSTDRRGVWRVILPSGRTAPRVHRSLMLALEAATAADRHHREEAHPMTTHDRPAGVPRRWDIQEGSYFTTSDDRAGRWYLVDRDGDIIDKRGAGHPTRAAAWAAVVELLWDELRACPACGHRPLAPRATFCGRCGWTEDADPMRGAHGRP